MCDLYILYVTSEWTTADHQSLFAVTQCHAVTQHFHGAQEFRKYLFGRAGEGGEKESGIRNIFFNKQNLKNECRRTQLKHKICRAQFRGQRGSKRQLLNLLTGLHLKGLRQAICYLFNKPQFCCGKDSHELSL